MIVLSGGHFGADPLLRASAENDHDPDTIVSLLSEIAPGLFRWTAPHPDWRPDAEPESPLDWPQHVGSVLFVSRDVAVFIDPLLPPEQDELWRALDERAGGRRAFVLTTIHWHERSRDVFVERYRADTPSDGSPPAGVEAFPLERLDETVFWLPEHRTLVPGDRIIGAEGGGLRMCPASWLGYLPGKPGLEELRAALSPLLELPIEHVLVSHGEPVLEDGRAALDRALAG